MDKKISIAELLKLVQGIVPYRPQVHEPAATYSYALSFDAERRPPSNAVERFEHIAIENGRLSLQVEVMIARLDGAPPKTASMSVSMLQGVAATPLGAWIYDETATKILRWEAA